ncbi:hypothetical protein NEOLEDRAFT_1181127 [Neolentinus lepideus HHB14362 ss-1]|uniref:Uncharacterized protein n=1 Tax=Neolentinus lepideus HHB14362 ss-1 TaxID=1314782 RepID=A0A165QCZ9_9AGAM|nr:hypothetical protein NEOLEDRAFT_1181127 [Neolentinus lepideus HHB14362 ss-1]
MTGLKRDGQEVTPRKSGRKSLPSRRLGSPVSITSSQRPLLSGESMSSCTDSVTRESGEDHDTVTLTTVIAEAKEHVKKKKRRVIVIEETDDEDKEEDDTAGDDAKVKEELQSKPTTTSGSISPFTSSTPSVVENQMPEFACARKVSGVRRSPIKSKERQRVKEE